MLPNSNKQDFAGYFDFLPKPLVLSGEQKDISELQSTLLFPIPSSHQQTPLTRDTERCTFHTDSGPCQRALQRKDKP